MLTGPDPVFTWVSGTGARPTLQALPDDLRPGFEEEFKRRLRAAYPERDGRVVLPFRRVFVVARGRRMIALHHVQVACPPGGEDAVRRFYGDGLGLTEVEKPADLRGRGGAWFRAYDERGAVAAELHVGVEDPFVPARKAHPAFVVDDLDAIAGSVDRGRRRRRLERARHVRRLPAVPRPRPARQPGRGAPAARQLSRAGPARPATLGP